MKRRTTFGGRYEFVVAVGSRPKQFKVKIECEAM